jgi:hypothetical protein
VKVAGENEQFRLKARDPLDHDLVRHVLSSWLIRIGVGPLCGVFHLRDPMFQPRHSGGKR